MLPCAGGVPRGGAALCWGAMSCVGGLLSVLIFDTLAMHPIKSIGTHKFRHSKWGELVSSSS